MARPAVGNSVLVVPGQPYPIHPCWKRSLIEVSAAPDEFESDISYVDPPTRKQRPLLSVSEQGETTSTEDEEVGEDDGEDDEDESEEQP